MSRKPEKFFKTRVFLYTKVLPLQKYRARTADDRDHKIPEEKIIPARRCAERLSRDGPSMVRTAAMPPASLRLFGRSPDALRVIHFIPRPRTMGYIRSGAVDGAFYAWIS
jgi:hypothetical protein